MSIHGLGYSLVNTFVPQYGIQSRLFVLATPTEPEHIALHLCLSLKRLRSGAAIHPLLAPIPGGPLSRLIAGIIHSSLVHDAGQDFAIWQKKRYLHPPALAEGDGPIGKFRLWARQFYHEPPIPLDDVAD